MLRARSLVALAFGAAAIVAGLRPRRVEVVGESMLPALRPGDRLLLMRLPVSPGVVVAVGDPRDPARTLLKRLAAGPGGEALLAGGVRLEAGRGYVVTGDNPPASTDSAVFGAVPARLLRGRAVYRYAPPGRRGSVRAARPGAGAGRGDAGASPDGTIVAAPAMRPAVAPADHQKE